MNLMHTARPQDEQSSLIQVYNDEEFKVPKENILSLANSNRPFEERMKIIWDRLMSQTDEYAKMGESGEETSEKTELPYRWETGYSIIRTNLFQITVTTVILISAITLGIETNIRRTFGALEIFFTIFFVLEVGIKIVTLKCKVYWVSLWNVFDFILAFICTADLTVTSLAYKRGDIDILAKLFRVLRIFRLVKLARVFPPLEALLVGLKSSLEPLFWVAFMLILLFYASAVFITTFVGHNSMDWKKDNLDQEIEQWFGTVPKSMYTLFQIMTLESWSMAIVRPVTKVMPETYIFFILFLCMTTFAFLNIITGIVVDSTMKACKESEQKKKHLKDTWPKLLKMLKSMDQDDSGTLCQVELEKAMDCPLMRDEVKNMGVDPDDVPLLYNTFDADGDGEVNYKEFIREFLALNDPVLKKDVALLRGFVLKMEIAVQDLIEDMKEEGNDLAFAMSSNSDDGKTNNDNRPGSGPQSARAVAWGHDDTKVPPIPTVQEPASSSNISDDWKKTTCPETSKPYYYNQVTKETAWERPQPPKKVEKKEEQPKNQSNSEENNIVEENNISSMIKEWQNVVENRIKKVDKRLQSVEQQLNRQQEKLQTQLDDIFRQQANFFQDLNVQLTEQQDLRDEVLTNQILARFKVNE